MELIRASALEISAALARKEISAAELMDHTLTRIECVNPHVNALVSLRDVDDLMAQARAADRSERRGWLHGMPVAVKDLANVAGLPTSHGSPLFQDHIAEADDLTAARLRAAGAIFIGKTNTPEFGLGSHTVNPVHGVTRNPYDLRKSAGGSSGGAAVALATGMVSVADGSDMMGSLRNPAGWNNVYGMRPTWGLVPDPAAMDGFINQFSTHGPMARSPSDLAALLDTMAGSHPHAPFGRDHSPMLPMIDALESPPHLGWLADWGGSLPMEEGVLACCETALGQMEGLGWQVTPVGAPFPAADLWTSWTALRSTVIAMTKRPDYEDRDRRALLGPALIWEIENGLQLDSADIWQASVIRTNWFRRCADLFEIYDVLVLPSAQLWPFDAALAYPREITGHVMDTYHRWMEVVIPASLLGLPVVNVPCGFGANGLPMGVQLIGRAGDDLRLLQTAQQWHRATQWPQHQPPEV